MKCIYEDVNEMHFSEKRQCWQDKTYPTENGKKKHFQGEKQMVRWQ